jgi:hypothetical protein
MAKIKWSKSGRTPAIVKDIENLCKKLSKHLDF